MSHSIGKHFDYLALTVDNLREICRGFVTGVELPGDLIEVVSDSFQLGKDGRVICSVDDQTLTARDDVFVDRQIRLLCF